MLKTFLPVLLLASATAFCTPSNVRFSRSGILHVNEKPFFPIAVYTYGVTAAVAAEVRAKGINTIAWGFSLPEAPIIEKAGLMMISPSEPGRIRPMMNSPAFLAWYLYDEPEGHNQTTETVRAAYWKLKQRDPNHPIGLCHFLYDAFEQYKGSSDFVMSDVYPVTANRDVPLRNVGIHLDRAHSINGHDFPAWGIIQVFGGPETDGGKWAVPTPEEVRCMTYIALVHRSTAIMYFSYWPRAPLTWQSLGPLNREIAGIVPWLVSEDCIEKEVRSSSESIRTRVRANGASGVLMMVNTERDARQTSITCETLAGKTLLLVDRSKNVLVVPPAGKLECNFASMEAKIYTWGPAPKVDLFDPKQGEAAKRRAVMTNSQ